jgi:hypothetical protein
MFDRMGESRRDMPLADVPSTGLKTVKRIYYVRYRYYVCRQCVCGLPAGRFCTLGGVDVLLFVALGRLGTIQGTFDIVQGTSRIVAPKQQHVFLIVKGMQGEKSMRNRIVRLFKRPFRIR